MRLEWWHWAKVPLDHSSRNPRPFRQWTRILSHTSVLITNQLDFKITAFRTLLQGLMNSPIVYSLNTIMSSGRSLQYTLALLHWEVITLPCSSVTSGSFEIKLSRSSWRSVVSLFQPKALTESQNMPQSVTTGEGIKLRLTRGSNMEEIVPAALSESKLPWSRLWIVSVARWCSVSWRYLPQWAVSFQAPINMLLVCNFQ